MSETPSWLTEENISAAATAAQNPAVQKAAVKVASNPQAQQAAKEALRESTSESPAWAAAAPSGSAHDVEAAVRHSDLNVSPEELKEMQKYHLFLRVAYIVVSICMAAAAVLALSKASFSTFFICGYVFFFSVLICCFEFGLKTVAQSIASNFGFMYTLLGRMLFLASAAGMCVKLGLFGIIDVALLALCAAFNFYVIYKFPKFPEYLRKKHYAGDTSN